MEYMYLVFLHLLYDWGAFIIYDLGRVEEWTQTSGQNLVSPLKKSTGFWYPPKKTDRTKYLLKFTLICYIFIDLVLGIASTLNTPLKFSV